MRVIMRSSIRGRLRPSSCRAPCVDALLLPPTRLSVVGAYAIAATAAGIADVRLPLERDEFGTGQNARRRPVGHATAEAQASGGPRGGCGGIAGLGTSGSSSRGTIQTCVQCGRRAQRGAVSVALNDVV